MKRTVMSDEGLNCELAALIELAQRAKIAPTTVIGQLFIHVIAEAKRGGIDWHNVAGAFRLCWQTGLPAPPAPGACPCLRLTLVDVPRAAMNPADPHHPSCEYYMPPPAAGPVKGAAS